MGDKKMAMTTNKGKKGLDVSIKFFDSFIRAMDALKKSIEILDEASTEHDALVNNGVGYVEDKKLTHGISMGAVNSGIYGGTDLVYNPTTGEYLVMTKNREISRYDWTGTKVGSVLPTKKFTRFIFIPETGNYIGYTPGKMAIYILKEEFQSATDSICIMPIEKIVYSGKKTEENSVEFYCLFRDTVNKYSYNITGNAISLQDCLPVPDIKADDAVIEQTCFDEAEGGQNDKKQWMYLTFRQHCTIIDAQGRSHGTKKNLHRSTITAILAIGSSEFVITGDASGLLKMWGSRWAFLTEIRPHSALCTHLIEHPNGRAIVSFSSDQSIFAYSLDTMKKLESMKAPEIVEKIAVNQKGKGFMAMGPRKLVLWKMDVLFTPHTQMSNQVSLIETTWNPNYPTRAIVATKDNAVRLVNPVTGSILTTALINPMKPLLIDLCYIPQYTLLYIIRSDPENLNSLEILLYDCHVNPCKLRDTWQETKWNEVGITTVALFDQIESMLIPEKSMSFQKKKQEDTGGQTHTFLIVGLRDGSVGRMDMVTGDIDFKVQCHKGQVSHIVVNPEINQFASMGSEPSIRIWKVVVSQPDDLFVPIFEITWKFPVRHVALVRETICFALSHHDSPTHKVVCFNMLETERYDHRASHAHAKEILSISGSRELKLFCSASLDETIRIWNDRCDIIRLLVLNWVPSYAAFGSLQADIFVGIGNAVNLIAADIYLPIIYRNRAMMTHLTPGPKEMAVPLNLTRTTQDPRMYIVYEEAERKEREKKEQEREKAGKKYLPEKKKEEDELDKELRVPPIGSFREPKDSQRAKDYEKLRLLEEDLKQIQEGNHNFSIYVPDFHKMTKKQLDDYGKSIFTGEDGDKRKLFASESRVAGVVEMERAMKELDNFQED